MDITFPEKDMTVIIEKIKQSLGNRELGKMVSFDLEGNEMVVTISKFGTSTLHFSHKQTGTGTLLTMGKEKIAFAHRPMKNEVTEKIVKVITQAGGTVSA